jgi:TRAP-type C4-dicarboxylate transport system substrate-binding protein
MVLVGAADIMSRKPIRKLEDRQGLKIIAQGEEIIDYFLVSKAYRLCYRVVAV